MKEAVVRVVVVRLSREEWWKREEIRRVGGRIYKQLASQVGVTGSTEREIPVSLEP